MKTRLYILSAIVLFIFAMQTTTAQTTWDYDGNTTSGEYIGTNNNQPFSIYTNALGTTGGERMRVDANGNVGIGTTTPYNLLQLNNAGSFNLQLTNSVTGTGVSDGLRIGLDGSGNANFQSETNFNFFVGSLHMMELFGSNRYMGLGWCSNFNPQSQLHLWNDVNQMYIQIATIDCGSSATDGFKIGVNDNAIYNNEPVAELRQQENAHMVFLTNNTERVRIQDDGEVEIHVVNNDDLLDRILMFDNNNNGLVKYRNLTSLPFVTSCTAGTSNYLTKWCANPSAIQNSIIFDNGTRAGIGTTSPIALLDINNTNSFAGLRSRTTSTAQIGSYGVWGQSTSTSSIFNIGTYGAALNTSSNIINNGVWGVASGNTNLFNVGGVFMTEPECVTDQIRSRLNVGLYARGTGWEYANDLCAPGTAAIFNGDIFVTGAINPPSDLRLKDSITEYSGALKTISKLQPKRYVFKKSDYPSMQLPVGGQIGFIAQQVDTVLPQLISETIHPPVYDSSGTLIYDSVHYRALNYTGLIPITIAAIQEQQLQIDSLVGDKITACGTTDSNYLAKWTKDYKVLCNSIIYDNGSRIGIPAPDDGAFVNVFNENDSVTAKFSSNYTGTTEVVKATYSTDGNSRDATAVSGYSKFIDDESKDGGLGGAFTGGQAGAVGKGVGTNTREFAVGLIGTAEGGGDVSAGVMGQVNVEEDVVHIGVVGMSENSTISNIGVGGSASEPNSVADNTGVYGIAGGSSIQNTAGYFTAYDTVGINYGVFAYADNSIGGNYAGYFDGNVHATGTVTWTSDGMLKDHVNDIDGRTALQQLLRLSPKTYRYKRDDYPFLALPQGNQYGLIAQEVERIFPELVADVEQPDIKDMKGRTIGSGFHYKGLNYVGLIPVLVSAVKQQQAKIDSLSHVITTRLDALEAKLNGCCGSGDANKTDNGNESTPNVNRISVELSSMQVIVLEQNVPNPFAEQTSISYYIPEGYRSAQMIFTDMHGHVIKTAEVNSGYGTVTVFASNLSTGQYSYTLVVDGKTVETKRMMKTK